LQGSVQGGDVKNAIDGQVLQYSFNRRFEIWEDATTRDSGWRNSNFIGSFVGPARNFNLEKSFGVELFSWKTFTTFSPEIKFLVKCLPFQRQVYIKLPCLVLFVAAVPIMPMPTASCLLLACVLRSPQFFVSMLRTFWLARRGSLEKRGRFFRHTPHMPVGKEKRIGRIKVE
jgi:hypothetical protein